VQKELEAYEKSKDQAVIELKVFEHRTHGIVNQEGWEGVADTAVGFAEAHMKN
jgi:hypothetical protein